ncbi:hypothetical protein [Photobacterium profundum]|nr:hypothetical protein [Photobacterium profundum]
MSPDNPAQCVWIGKGGGGHSGTGWVGNLTLLSRREKKAQVMGVV